MFAGADTYETFDKNGYDRPGNVWSRFSKRLLKWRIRKLQTCNFVLSFMAVMVAVCGFFTFRNYFLVGLVDVDVRHMHDYFNQIRHNDNGQQAYDMKMTAFSYISCGFLMIKYSRKDDTDFLIPIEAFDRFNKFLEDFSSGIINSINITATFTTTRNKKSSAILRCPVAAWLCSNDFRSYNT
uniref:Uncharacterized protein n=1 Tax=Glossina brevipalpis TaxID=37001 RepID=A0A1A9X018_9MUSC